MVYQQGHSSILLALRKAREVSLKEMSLATTPLDEWKASELTLNGSFLISQNLEIKIYY
jgi:hypothetical protein